MIEGVKTKRIEDITGPQGSIQHMLREGDGLLGKCGEVYFSTVNPGVTKAWHVHDIQTSTISCIKGRVLLVLYDRRVGSPSEGKTMEFIIGDGSRLVVQIPHGVVYGWKNLADTPSMLANCASHAHDPERSHKIDIDRIPYEWK